MDGSRHAEIDDHPILLVRRSFARPAIRRMRHVPVVAIVQLADRRRWGRVRRGQPRVVGAVVVDREVRRRPAATRCVEWLRRQLDSDESSVSSVSDFAVGLPSTSTCSPAPSLYRLPVLSHTMLITVTAIRHIVEREVIPFGRRERIHFQSVVIARSQADQSGDDEVAEARMEIVFASGCSRRVPRTSRCRDAAPRRDTACRSCDAIERRSAAA